jgi:hypothetical protein
MSKLATFFSLALLLSFSLTYSSRPNLGFKGVSNSLHEVRFHLNYVISSENQTISILIYLFVLFFI